MIRFVFPAILSLLGSAPTVAGQLPQSELTEKSNFLKARYASVNQAIQSLSYPKFKTWMESNAASDFSLRAGDGISATLAMTRNEFLVLKAVKSSTFRLSNLSIHPDHLSCSIKTHLDAVTKDGSRIVEDTLAVDTWHKAKDSWKLVSVVTTKDKFSANGKTVRSFGLSRGEVFP
jgi:hypothetical protein